MVPGGAFASGAQDHTTNQRMEIVAAFEATRALPGPLEIVSDSTYVVNCFRDGWWKGWIKRGWKNSKKEPVANRDLWEPFIELVNERGDVTFRWVKGHGGDPNNDLADRLAVEAADTQQARSGDSPPEHVAEPDKPSRGRQRGAGGSAGPGVAGRPAVERSERPVEGRLVALFGHRPPELGGYGPNPVADEVRRHLADILRAKCELHPDLVLLTGLRLGAEMLGAEAAVAAEVPYVAVLPYPDPASVWPAESQRRFAGLSDGAMEIVLLQKKVPESKQKAGAALARRDAWLARNADEAILVWDEQDKALGKLARSLEDHLGDDVWILNP